MLEAKYTEGRAHTMGKEDRGIGLEYQLGTIIYLTSVGLWTHAQLPPAISHPTLMTLFLAVTLGVSLLPV